MIDEPAPDAQTPAPGRGRRQGLSILAALVACALAAVLWPPGERTSLAPTRDPLDADGRRVPLGSRTGPVTLVHFWATWCPPCIAEGPALRRLVADLGGEPGFRIVLIAVEDRPEAATAFLGEIAPLNLFDPDWTVAHAWGTTQLPESYVVVDGRIVEKFAGSVEWDRPEIRARLRARIARGARPGTG